MGVCEGGGWSEVGGFGAGRGEKRKSSRELRAGNQRGWMG